MRCNAMTKEKTALVLSDIKSGHKARFVGLNAGYGLKTRLATMGLVPNTEITVVKNGHRGPFVVKVKSSKIALGRGLAQKIAVKEIHKPLAEKDSAAHIGRGVEK